MKTVSELQQLKRAMSAGCASLPNNVQVLSELIDQAIEDRTTISRWFGFLKLMASRSSWRDDITTLLDEYLYGTANKEVQQAAQRYIDRARLHERTLSK